MIVISGTGYGTAVNVYNIIDMASSYVMGPIYCVVV